MPRILQQTKSVPTSFLLFIVILLSFLPPVSAQRQTDGEDLGQDPAAVQAQATMASLFGRGAKMPAMPRVSGTIALPSFDKPGMRIDEESLRKTEAVPSEQRSTRNAQR